MRLAQRLGGGEFATALAGTCYLGTAFARLNLLFQPNSFEVFGFVLALYGLVVYQQTQRPRWLYLLGLALGLGLLNKYTTLFFIAALGGALLLTPARRLLGSRHFWGAALLALLLWAPNVAWQLQHGIPFRHHMQLLHDTQLVHVEAAEFWKLQLLMCVGAVWVWVPGLLALLLSPALRPYRAVGWVAVLGVGLQALLHGKAYYTLGYYPALFSFGAWWWEAWLRARSRAPAPAGPAGRPARLVPGPGYTVVRLALVLLPLALLAPLFPLIYPVRSPAAMQALGARYAPLGLYTWEDGRIHALPQDYADMRGWRELADHTWAAYQGLPAAVRAPHPHQVRQLRPSRRHQLLQPRAAPAPGPELQRQLPVLVPDGPGRLAGRHHRRRRAAPRARPALCQLPSGGRGGRPLHPRAGHARHRGPAARFGPPGPSGARVAQRPRRVGAATGPLIIFAA